MQFSEQKKKKKASHFANAILGDFIAKQDHEIRNESVIVGLSPWS